MNKFDGLTERLGEGLQNLLHGFESRTRLENMNIQKYLRIYFKESFGIYLTKIVLVLYDRYQQAPLE